MVREFVEDEVLYEGEGMTTVQKIIVGVLGIYGAYNLLSGAYYKHPLPIIWGGAVLAGAGYGYYHWSDMDIDLDAKEWGELDFTE